MISEKVLVGAALAVGAAVVLFAKTAKCKVDGNAELKNKGKQVVDDTVELGKAVGSVAKSAATEAWTEIKQAKDVILNDITGSKSTVEVAEEDTAAVDKELVNDAVDADVADEIESILDSEEDDNAESIDASDAFDDDEGLEDMDLDTDDDNISTDETL